MTEFDQVAVFSDGFKGLPDGWKTLAPVTFVTGENSSGKTSLLDLISILDSPDFILMNNILRITEDINRASDVVSRFGSGKSVTIGFLSRKNASSDGDLGTYSGKIVTYKADKQNEAMLTSSITVISERRAIRIKQRGKSLVGRMFEAGAQPIGLQGACDLASEAHFDTGHGYSTLVKKTSSEPFGLEEWFSASFGARHLLKKKDANREFDREEQIQTLATPPFSAVRYGPIRSEVSRISHGSRQSEFDEGGAHYPFKIRRIEETDQSALAAIKRFGRESGLFDNLRIEKLSSEKGSEAFSILYSKFGKEFYADELGYGLGQIVPIVTDLLEARGRVTFLIQQPEVHLHPKAQAAFGQLLHTVGSKGFNLIIETHSDFLIDRFRLTQAKSKEKVEAEILFFEKPIGEKRPRSTAIQILENGHFEGLPEAYREFFINESIEIFENL